MLWKTDYIYNFHLMQNMIMINSTINDFMGAILLMPRYILFLSILILHPLKRVTQIVVGLILDMLMSLEHKFVSLSNHQGLCCLALAHKYLVFKQELHKRKLGELDY